MTADFESASLGSIPSEASFLICIILLILIKFVYLLYDMVFVFFYGKFNKIEIIEKIKSDYEYYAGHVIVQKYDNDNDIIEISDNLIGNTVLLFGKIVNFDMKIEDVMKKIHTLDEFKFKKYNFETVWATTLGTESQVKRVYIIK